jgi:hypothetical protein
VSTHVSSMCAGWLPQDGLSDRLSRIERDQLQGNVIAHGRDAGHSQTLAAAGVDVLRTIVGCYSSSTASDQHQPASSRAIAALATTD